MGILTVAGFKYCEVCEKPVYVTTGGWRHELGGTPLCEVGPGLRGRVLEDLAALAGKSTANVARGFPNFASADPEVIRRDLADSAATAHDSGGVGSVSGVGGGSKKCPSCGDLQSEHSKDRWDSCQLMEHARIERGANHQKVMAMGLRQLEWDHGGTFVDSNKVVDRHNREIVIAFEMGLQIGYSRASDDFVKGNGQTYGETGSDMNPETGCISNKGMALREKYDEGYAAGKRDAFDDLGKNAKIEFRPFDLTLRDQFAMAALGSLSATLPKWVDKEGGAKTYAECAYFIADAMLEWRK